MKNKGFTLIELLAVIVILAIIALIATPIILNIINDSKVESKKRSAENYLDAVELAIANKNLEGKFNPRKCTIEEKTKKLTCEGEFDAVHCDGENPCTSPILEVKVDGEVPTEVIIEFSDGTVANGTTITIGGTPFEKNNAKLELATKTEQTGNFFDSICMIADDSEVQGYNEGAKYNCIVDPTKEAYTFYVLPTTEENKVNLIMDKNICENGNPMTSSDDCRYAYNITGDAQDQGPVTALEVLNNATSNWRDELKLNETYVDEGGHFTITLTGKARLPKTSEIADYSADLNNGYLYENLASLANGYWGMSTSPTSSKHAYMVMNMGNSVQHQYDGGSSNVDWASSMGIRPVISFDI